MSLPPERIWEMLLEAARAMDVQVRVEALEEPGRGGGACRVGDRWMVLVDEALGLEQRVGVLKRALRKIVHEGVYLRPAVRQLLEEGDE